MGKANQNTHKAWTVRKLAILTYIFVSAAAALNIFMISLAGSYIGVPQLSPVGALGAGVVAGVPLSWKTGQWVRRLMDEAGDD